MAPAFGLGAIDCPDEPLEPRFGKQRARLFIPVSAQINEEALMPSLMAEPRMARATGTAR